MCPYGIGVKGFYILFTYYIMNPIKKLSELAVETEVVCTEDWFTVTVWDLIHDIKSWTERGEDQKWREWYIAELEDMKKYDISYLIDTISEDLNEQCEDWSERNWDTLDELEKDFKIAFDKFREKLWNARKVYSCQTKVEIDIQ